MANGKFVHLRWIMWTGLYGEMETVEVLAPGLCLW